ncbi:serine hydrolase [Pantoea sp. Nvir]|uniref:serine hydrolase n=1 Tax=Pantoea sp. Nvir TaxID=2576760 RepID=UPI0027F602F9|nr:D-alanyl-D-alanine carboxypeptidase DacC [Pantoea sp. Nvir]
MISMYSSYSLRYTTAAFLLVFITPVFSMDAPIPPHINAKAWILMDYASGKVLTEGNADDRLDPASLTKMMTSYVIGQALKAGKIKRNDIVTVGHDAWVNGNPTLKGSSLMFLKPGDQIPVSELNKGIVIQSGNDACIALADYVAGSQEAFIDLMNNYLNSFGLKNTHFMTVHGLDTKGQYSTARDMALIGQALIRDVPEEYTLNKEKEFTFNRIRQMNRNRLLWNTHLNVDGIKTGHTSGAGNNLVASATENNMRLISVVLGTTNDISRFSESEKLLTWGFRFFETVMPVKMDKPFTQQRVWFGDRKKVNLGIEKDVVLTLPKGQMQNLKTSYNLTTLRLEAPLKKNQVVGIIDFQLDGKIIEQCPLIVIEDVLEGSLFRQLIDFVFMQLHTLFDNWFN